MDISSEYTIAFHSLKKEKEFWQKQFECINKSIFPYDSPFKGANRELSNHEFIIEGDKFERLIKMANGSDYRMQTIVITIVTLLLRKYTRNDAITLGTAVERQENESSLINKILPLTLAVSGDTSFRDVLYHVNDSLKQVVEHQNFPVLEYSKELNSSSTDHNLFDVGVLLSNIQDVSYLDEIHVSLIFDFKVCEHEIVVSILYNPAQYEFSTIERITDHLALTVEFATGDVENKVSEMSLISNTELEMLDSLNITPEYDLDNRSIPGLFKNVVERCANDTAVICGGSKLTYGQLDEKSNQVANKLLSKGVGVDDIIGIYINEVTANVVISILGVLKAGATYLPLDARVPKERIDFMIKESNASYVLSNKSEYDFAIESIDWNSDDHRVMVPDMSHHHADGGKSLAYVLYTSGTSGKPKGVKVNHTNVVNIIYGLNQVIFSKYDQPLRLGLISNLAFDASVQHLFGSLLLGNTLVMATEEEKESGESLIRFYNKQSIDISDGTPQHLKMINEAISNNPSLDIPLKHLIMGGDALSKNDIVALHKTHNSVCVTNVYGPTECTVNATYYNIDPNNIKAHNDVISIGRSLPNYKVFILDQDLKLLPQGVPGDLYIGGVGVSAGYIDSSLNTAAFKRNIFDTEVLYKTGDIAKWTEDWFLTFQGRGDQQIKLRGFRIELDEIKNAIISHEAIHEAVVKVNVEDDDKYIVAYYKTLNPVTEEELNTYLSNVLPHYMIPGFYVAMDEWPLSVSFKINHEALPNPKKIIGERELLQPQSETERKLKALWGEVLGHDLISIDDSFFNVGGDSLKLIRLMTIIKNDFNVSLKLVEVYGNESIKKLAMIIDSKAIEKNDDTDEIYRQLEVMKENTLKKLQ